MMDNLERVSLELRGIGRCDVMSLQGREGLSTLFEYTLTSALAAHEVEVVDVDALCGEEARFVIRDSAGGSRTVIGIIESAELEPFDERRGKLTVRVRPAFYRASLGRDARAFQDLDAVAIAKAVLAGAGMPARFEITGSYATRVYTVQYEESDFAFVSRLLEEEGIYYWFDHEKGSELVIADRSSAAPDLDRESWGLVDKPLGALFLYREGAALNVPADVVTQMADVVRVVPSKFTSGSFDFQKPSFKVGASAGDGALEMYDAPGAGHDDPSVLEARTKRREEGARARAALVHGRSPSVRLTPGRLFDLGGHVMGRLDGKLLVTGVEISVEGIGFNREASAKPVDVRFHALPASLSFRPDIVTPHPRHVGLQSGAVVGPKGEEVHPDEFGRVRIQQHWDRLGGRDEKSGTFVRVAQRGTGGSMLLPRTGWNVLSVAEEGSVDMPVILSRTFDAEHPPPYKLPDNKTRVAYKTATSPGGGSENEIRFEDKKGQEEMFINSTRDLNVLVKNQKAEVVHANMTRKVGVDHVLDVGGTYDVQVKGSQSVTVGGNQTETVAAERTKLVDGSETITIGGSRKLKTGENFTSSGEKRSMKAGAAQIDLTLGGIEATSRIVNTLVGGAVIKVTPRNMKESVGSTVTADTVLGYLPESTQASIAKLKKIPGVSQAMAKIPSKKAGASFQTVGITKIELGLERKVEVVKSYTETIMGMLEMLSTALTENTTEGFKIEAKTLSHDSDQITITSDKEVEIKSGATSILVSAKDGIKVTSSSIQLKDASGVIAKGKIKHNM